MNEQEAKKSNFRFSNPKITEFSFKANQDFSNESKEQMPISYTCKKTMGDFNTAKIALDMIIGKENNDFPFFIKISIEAGFKWEDGIEEDLRDKLLDKNAVLLLVSYVRPIVAHMTADAGYKPLTIPFLDIR